MTVNEFIADMMRCSPDIRELPMTFMGDSIVQWAIVGLNESVELMTDETGDRLDLSSNVR